MHTENEAKNKWCPMVRNGDGYTFKNESGEQSQQSFSNVDAKCIASRCMMWRWRYKKHERTCVGMSPLTKTDKGYCGITGRVK